MDIICNVFVVESWRITHFEMSHIHKQVKGIDAPLQFLYAPSQLSNQILSSSALMD
jgi:hypothetical protein